VNSKDLFTNVNSPVDHMKIVKETSVNPNKLKKIIQEKINDRYPKRKPFVTNKSLHIY